MDTTKMILMIRVIEDYYITDFPKIASEHDDYPVWPSCTEEYTELMQECDMSWGRVGMILDLGYLETTDLGPFHEKIEKINEHDPIAFIMSQIDAERTFLPDESLKLILDKYIKDDPNGDRITKKAFKAAWRNESIKLELLEIITN